jgi:predicted nucleotidyltransferase
MLQRPTIIDELQVILAEWIAGVESPKPIGAYLFGSTVNDGGVRFDPGSGDLDVIIVLNWDKVPAGERVEHLKALRQAKEDLEISLFRKLRREKGSDRIVSLVPVTPFEVDQAVHKDNVKHILTKAIAYDLLEKREISSLDGGRAARPLSDSHGTV